MTEMNSIKTKKKMYNLNKILKRDLLHYGRQ